MNEVDKVAAEAAADFQNATGATPELARIMGYGAVLAMGVTVAENPIRALGEALIALSDRISGQVVRSDEVGKESLPGLGRVLTADDREHVLQHILKEGTAKDVHSTASALVLGAMTMLLPALRPTQPKATGYN